MHFNKNGSMMVRGSTNMDTTRHDGPNHLGLWCDALPENQMALITSDCHHHQDSSKIVESLLSPYQRSLLAMVFMNDEHQVCPQMRTAAHRTTIRGD